MRRDILLVNDPAWCKKHLTRSASVMMACVGCGHSMHVHEEDIPHARKGRSPRYRCSYCHTVNVLVPGMSGHHVVLARWDGNAPAIQMEMKIGGVK